MADAIESFAVVDNSARMRAVVNLTGLFWKHRDLIKAIDTETFLPTSYWHNRFLGDGAACEFLGCVTAKFRRGCSSVCWFQRLMHVGN